MKKVHFITVIACILLVSCNMEEKRWGKAIEKNSIDDFVAFRKKYPQSKYDSLALSKIVELEWKTLSVSDSIELFMDFQKSYPANRYSDTIKTLAEKAKISSYRKAIQYGDIERVKRIIDYDSTLVKQENYLTSAIMVAADNCRLEMVEFFRRYIPDVNICNVDGTTLLHHAVKGGCVNIVNYLLANGADVNRMVKEVEYLRGFFVGGDGMLHSFGFGHEDTDPEMYGSPLQWAARFSQPEIARILIEKGADVNKETNREYSILTDACASGSAELVELLLSKGAKWHYDNVDYTQPIHQAKTGEIVRMLINKGESINAYCSDYGLPIHYASYRGFTDAIAFYLKEGVDVNKKANIYVAPIKGTQTVTPVWLAAYNGNLETIRLLESKGADMDFCARSEYFNGTLLHAAAIGGDSTIVSYLVSKGKNIESKTNFEKLVYYSGIPVGGDSWKAMTPLALAVFFDNFNAVKVLVEKGADINYKNPQGWSVLDFAVFVCEDIEMTRYLLDKGAVPEYKNPSEVEDLNTSDEIIEVLKDYLKKKI